MTFFSNQCFIIHAVIHAIKSIRILDWTVRACVLKTSFSVAPPFPQVSMY